MPEEPRKGALGNCLRCIDHCYCRHVYEDGRPEDVSLRKAAGAEGEIRVLQPVRLTDFLATPRGNRILSGRRR